MSRTHRNQYRMPERGKVAALPKFQFLLEIAREIVMPRELDGGAEGRVGLHENFARRFAPARATRNLREQLERPFARAKIRHVQREIGVDDSNESDVRKMETFRDHLRADENVDLTDTESMEGFAICILAGHRIGVHPAHDGIGKNIRDICLDFFSSETGINQRVLRTGWAVFRYRRGV